MSDHFYPRAYGRLAALADGRCRSALASLDMAHIDLVRDLIRSDLQKVIDVIAEVEQQQAERMAELEARLKALSPIIPVEVQ